MLLLDIWYAAVIHPIENIVISRIHLVKPEEIETALKANRPRMIIANVEFIASPADMEFVQNFYTAGFSG